MVLSNFNKKNNEGFTLIEMLMAISIGVLVATTVTAVAVSTLKSVRMAKHMERLHSNAFYVSTTIGYWMRQGAQFNVSNPTTLLITMPFPDLSTKTITLSAERITLDGMPIMSDDVRVTYFQVTPSERSVQFGFSLQFGNSPETFSATTTVAQRNLL